MHINIYIYALMCVVFVLRSKSQCNEKALFLSKLLKMKEIIFFSILLLFLFLFLLLFLHLSVLYMCACCKKHVWVCIWIWNKRGKIDFSFCSVSKMLFWCLHARSIISWKHAAFFFVGFSFYCLLQQQQKNACMQK